MEDEKAIDLEVRYSPDLKQVTITLVSDVELNDKDLKASLKFYIENFMVEGVEDDNTYH